MNWWCPKQVPHYPSARVFILFGKFDSFLLIYLCNVKKNCNIFQKHYKKWSNLHYQNTFSKSSQFFGPKNNKICQNKKSQLSVCIPRFLWSPHLSTLAWSELTIIRDNGGSNLTVKVPWWGHSQIRALWWDDSRV